MTETRFRQAFLLLLVTAISAAFVAMIRGFLLTILLSAIFAGLSYPVYEWILVRIGGRKALAAIATLLMLLVLVMVPLLAVLGAGANEALRVTETIRPRLEQLVDQPGEFDRRQPTVMIVIASYSELFAARNDEVRERHLLSRSRISASISSISRRCVWMIWSASFRTRGSVMRARSLVRMAME